MQISLRSLKRFRIRRCSGSYLCTESMQVPPPPPPRAASSSIGIHFRRSARGVTKNSRIHPISKQIFLQQAFPLFRVHGNRNSLFLSYFPLYISLFFTRSVFHKSRQSGLLRAAVCTRCLSIEMRFNRSAGTSFRSSRGRKLSPLSPNIYDVIYIYRDFYYSVKKRRYIHQHATTSAVFLLSFSLSLSHLHRLRVFILSLTRTRPPNKFASRLTLGSPRARLSLSLQDGIFRPPFAAVVIRDNAARSRTSSAGR